MGLLSCLRRGQASAAKISTAPSVVLVAQLVKNPPAIQETPVQFLGREDPLKG